MMADSAGDITTDTATIVASSMSVVLDAIVHIFADEPHTAMARMGPPPIAMRPVR
jgi:hypothetical protein